METTWPNQFEEILKNVPQARWRNAALYSMTNGNAEIHVEQLHQIFSSIKENGGFTIRVTKKDVQELQQTITFPRAAETPAWPMGTHVWIRDLTLVADRLLTASDSPLFREKGVIGKDLLRSALSLMSTPAQLQRFQDIISGKADHTDAKKWPHIFLDSRDNLSGNREEGWAHKQEAWQMTATLTLRHLRLGTISMRDLLPEHIQFLQFCGLFLNKVKFWENPSSGSWEELEAIRSSVIVWEVALLQELEQSAFAHGVALAGLITKGQEVLKASWPNESSSYAADDPRYRTADAALVYMLQLEAAHALFGEEDAEGKEAQVLRLLESLEDEYGGMYRYEPDSYQRHDFFRPDVAQRLQEFYGSTSGEASSIGNFTGREHIVPQGRQASWVHPIWQLSAWYGRKFLQTRMPGYKQKQHEYFLKGLALVTGESMVTIEPNEAGVVTIKHVPAWSIPECYISLTVEGRGIIVPSPHTPLNWAVAEAIDAFVVMEQTLQE